MERTDPQKRHAADPVVAAVYGLMLRGEASFHFPIPAELNVQVAAMCQSQGYQRIGDDFKKVGAPGSAPT